MGNTPIQMGLKTDKQCYYSGEIMTGTVYINVTQLTPAISNYQGIRLQFTGQENTEVRVEERTGSGDNRTTSYRTCRESSSILRVEVPMMNFASPLRVAKYEFPFEWKLPDQNTAPLPSSFRHRVLGDHRRGYCEVRYTLTAYLVPQPAENNSIFGVVPNSMTSISTTPGKNGSTCASQRIHFVGAPTRSIPEPIHIGEERTVMNGFCCCWKQGHVSLGWEADSIVMTPDATCNLQIWGSNSSALPVQSLRVQLIQSVKWQAAGSDSYDRQHHTRNNDSTLVDYTIDVSHLPQWDPLVRSSRRRQRQGGDYHPAATNNTNNNDTSLQQQFNYNNNYDDEDDEQHEPVATSFQVPSDIMDTYRGLNCTVEHTLVVSAVTRMMATTPQVPYKVHLQRNAAASMAMAAGAAGAPGGAALPVATAWMEESEYTDIVLPADWSPDEKVPVIHLREITAMDAGVVSGQGVGGAAATTAQAIVMDPPVNPAVATMNSPPPVAMHPSMMVHPSAPVEPKGYDPSAAAPPPTVVAYPAAPPAAAVYPTAPPAVAAYPTAPPAPPVAAAAAAATTVTPTTNEDHTMDFARPAGMTDEDIATPTIGGTTATAPPAMVEGQFTDLQEFQNLLRQINPNDMSTYRRVEQQIRSLPSCQRVLATMTPEDYQYLCQVGTPVSIARISFLLASELNKGAHGFRGAFLVALMQLPVAQETSITLIGSLTELISDLEQSSDYVQQSLRPDDAKWFKQRVDEWAY